MKTAPFALVNSSSSRPRAPFEFFSLTLSIRATRDGAKSLFSSKEDIGDRFYGGKFHCLPSYPSETKDPVCSGSIFNSLGQSHFTVPPRLIFPLPPP